MDEPLRVRQIIHGRVGPIYGPSGASYTGREGDEIEVATREDHEWLLSLRQRG